MPIRRAYDELSQAVSSVGGFGEDFGPASRDLLVVLIQAIDHYTCEPRMISDIAGGDFIRAFAEHELECVLRDKAPALGIYRMLSKAKHVGVEMPGLRQVADCQNTSGVDKTCHRAPPVYQLTVKVDAAARIQSTIGNWKSAMTSRSRRSRPTICPLCVGGLRIIRLTVQENRTSFQLLNALLQPPSLRVSRCRTLVLTSCGLPSPPRITLT